MRGPPRLRGGGSRDETDMTEWWTGFAATGFPAEWWTGFAAGSIVVALWSPLLWLLCMRLEERAYERTRGLTLARDLPPGPGLGGNRRH